MEHPQKEFHNDINKMMPSHIINKYEFYEFENKQILATPSMQYIRVYRDANRPSKITKEAIPFRKDKIQKSTTVITTKTIENYNYEPNHLLHVIGTLFICKTVTTYITNGVLKSIKDNSYYIMNNKHIKDFVKISNTVNLKSAIKIEYISNTGIYDDLYGTFLWKENIIFIYYKPYNNGDDRRYAIYTKRTISTLSVSPLQMLWRIKQKYITIKKLNELTTSNKIVGRSKLRKRLEYINVFMKL